MEREIINKEPYQLEGSSYMFFYDQSNGVVVCSMPYEYQERQADEDWMRENGEPLYDTIMVDGRKYVELESVGLAYENWQDQESRDEYLHGWIQSIRGDMRAEIEYMNTSDSIGKTIKVSDALMKHYSDIGSNEKALKSRILLATNMIEQHEKIYGPVYEKFDITKKLTNCIEDMYLGNADGTLELAIRENLQRYTTKQHKLDRFNDMALRDEQIRQVIDQQGELSKEIEQAARDGDYKSVKDKTDMFLQKGKRLTELIEDKVEKQISDLQQMKWDNMLNTDVWIELKQPPTYQLEDGTNLYMDYRLNDIKADQLRKEHENDIMNSGYPNGYYLATMKGQPQLVIHTKDGLIVSRTMTNDYDEGKSLASISHDLYEEYWSDMKKMELSTLSMDDQTAENLIKALARVDSAYGTSHMESVYEIDQMTGKSNQDLYFQQKEECRLENCLVPKIGIATCLEDGTYTLREVKIIDERLADMVINHPDQIVIAQLQADVRTGDYLLLKESIVEPYQTFSVTENGLVPEENGLKIGLPGHDCTEMMLRSSYDAAIDQQCVKPLVEHGVTLQPGIQTRFEKNERMFKLKNPVANEQQKHQQNKIEMSM